MIAGSALLLTVLSFPLFVDVTDETGINFPHHAAYLITGQAFADINRDGWPDLILTSGDGENGIILNQLGRALPRYCSATILGCQSICPAASRLQIMTTMTGRIFT